MAQSKSQTPFLVDRAGLAKLMARRPKGYVLLELLQNAWDEDARCVTVTTLWSKGVASIKVMDDSPEGFADLTHAYTLFAESRKAGDATKRGRFNLGEKLVIAICETAEIATTKGTIRFDRHGRRHIRKRRDAGTVFKATIRMIRAEADAMLADALRCIAPGHCVTWINGARLSTRKPIAEVEVTLPTEIADAEGYLRRTTRKTTIRVYEPEPGEPPTLYEMGIPVVDTGDTWHVDIAQKVPLNSDRDNVTPAYLRQVRTAVLNALVDRLTTDDSTAGWVGAALEDPDVTPEAVIAVLDKRFGERRVITDPSDREAEKRAVAAGYTVIPARAFNAAQWQNIRDAGAALPAGRVTPSPKPFSPDGKPLRTVPKGNWPGGVAETVQIIEGWAEQLTGGLVTVVIVNDPQWGFGGACGVDRRLYINIGRLGWDFLKTIDQRLLVFLIHELAHIFVSDHLSSAYADKLCDLGAALAIILAKGGHYDGLIDVP